MPPEAHSGGFLMKSPFPGMDPHIEACGLWEDFHRLLIAQIHDALAKAVPDRYIVRTGERAYVVLADENGKAEHVFGPDVDLLTPAAPRASAESGGVAVAEPPS